MAQEQVDPFAKWTNKEPPKNDPFSKWSNTRIVEEPVVEEPPIVIEEELPQTPPVVVEEPSMLQSFWDAITASALPESKNREYTPETLPPYFDRVIDEIGRGVYEEVVRPSVSVLGAGTAILGGPIARGALKYGRRIPGAEKVITALTKERSLFGKKAPIVDEVAKSVETALPEVKVNPVEGGLTFSDEVTRMPGGPNPNMYGIRNTNPMFASVPARMQGPGTNQIVFDALLPSRIKKQIGQTVKLAKDEIVEPEAAAKVIDDVVKSEATKEIAPAAVTPTIAKLHAALDESKPLTNKQAQIYAAERAKKFGAARNIDIEDAESGRKFLSQFAGEHTKVTRDPLKLDQTDVDDLHKMIGTALKSDVVDTPESARAMIALRKLLEGGVPQRSEIEVLEKIFGSGIAERLPKSTSGREIMLRTISIPKAIVSSIDLGFPFRQGINHVGQKEWRGMLRPSIQAYFSETSKDKWMEAIKASTNFDLKKRAGLALGELTGPGREEHIMNSFFGKVPGIRHSNRAYAVGASKLRSDLFDSMYRDYKRLYDSQVNLAAGNADMLAEAELLNPDNLRVARKMADLINTSTGRGTLGRLEPIAEELNATLFAPRLMSARFKTINRVLNPLSYAKSDPIERKYALKQLFSITGTILTSASLLKSAGAEIELDPRSSDFLKGKIGKTRFDFGGGYLQYIVPAAKILSSVGQEAGLPIDHSTKSVRTGNTSNLGENVVGQDKWDVFESFFTNKAAPLASLFVSFMRGNEPSGKEVDFTSMSPTENTAMKAITPFMIQDFVELYKEDPTLLPAMLGSMMGGNVQVYEDIASKSGRR